ncbi:MAG TPA: hypothetical protein VHO47_00215 [Candidatus Babeliales bacterium]|nr:hypothetical protein [Candidatus Babeliales bacterium]
MKFKVALLAFAVCSAPLAQAQNKWLDNPYYNFAASGIFAGLGALFYMKGGVPLCNLNYPHPAANKKEWAAQKAPSLLSFGAAAYLFKRGWDRLPASNSNTPKSPFGSATTGN